MVAATQLTDPVAVHGEGPVWWPDGRLLLVDMLAGDVLDISADQVRRRHVADVAAVVRPRTSGGAVVATDRGIRILDPTWNDEVDVPPLLDDPSIRMNEGSCDGVGRFYVGSMAVDAAPGRGRLYRWDAADEVHVVTDDVTISNGLAFAPDGSVAYYTDTATRRVDVLDHLDDGRLARRRPWIEFGPDEGAPDGIALDADGGLWVALWGAGRVVHHDERGRRDAVVEVPTPHVTACTLGGPRLDTLYITTSQLDLTDGDLGSAGAVFQLDRVTPGLPVLPCGF